MRAHFEATLAEPNDICQGLNRYPEQRGPLIALSSSSQVSVLWQRLWAGG